MADSAFVRFTTKPAPIHSLTIASLFTSLDEREKLYAHHMSRSGFPRLRSIAYSLAAKSIMAWYQDRSATDFSGSNRDLRLDHLAAQRVPW